MRRATTPYIVLLATLTAALHGQDTSRLPPPAKAAAQPIECAGNRDVVLANRFIRTSGHGVAVHGNCDVRIVDSHIVADGVAILVRSNADVVVVDSFLQGGSGAVDLEGNGSVSYRGSTLRGGTRARGNGELIDAGANTFEAIPGDTSGVVARGEVLSCEGRERLTVVNRYVESDGDGLTVAGDCEVLVSDSHIVARGAAVRVAGDGVVRLRNSTLEGGTAAVQLAGRGSVDAAGSNFFGAIELASAAAGFVDGGGNSAAGSGADVLSRARTEGRSRISAESAGPSPQTRITIGPGGVRVEGRGDSAHGSGTIVVGAEGVEIRSGTSAGERDPVERDPVERDPIESCADLCSIWPSLTEGQTTCAVVVLEIRGYAVYDHLACIGVETRAQCSLCAQVLEARDKDCLAIVDRCLPRR